jgi:hypothetical protein
MKKAMAKAKTKAKSKTKTTTKTKTRVQAKVTRPAVAAKSKEYRPEDLIRTNGSMEIDPGLMHMRTARAIAKSLKQSADSSKRLTHSPFHSALSTLNFLIAHVEVQKARLESARAELRQLYNEVEVSASEPSRTPDEYGWHRKSSKN